MYKISMTQHDSRRQDPERLARLSNPVRANAVGQYAMAALPKTDLKMRATSEAAVVEQSVAVGSLFFGSSVPPVDLKFKNYRPQIQAVVSRLDDKVVRSAASGAALKVSVDAQALNKDKLTYTWRAPEGMGRVAASDAQAEWTLPATPGRDTVYVLASDGNGGYASVRVSIQVGDAPEVFSGKVVDQNSSPIDKAEIEINGQKATSDAQGAFLLQVKPSDRYVMNITKPGFALFSQPFKMGVIGQTWRLVRAQVATVDPAKAIELIDRRPEIEKQQIRGVQIKVPAGSLVDASGNKPSGSISPSIATLDIANAEARGIVALWMTEEK